MDLEERLLDSHKVLSKLVASVLLVILVTSLYVLQRALAVIGNSPDLLQSVMSTGVQVNFLQLGFSYQAMTAIWPGVLGGLCILYRILEDRKTGIERSMRALSGAMNGVDVLEADPFHLTPSSFRPAAVARIATIFAWMPFLAAALHLLMLAMWGTQLGWGAKRRLWSSDHALGFTVVAGSVFSIASLLFSGVGLIGAWLFLKTAHGRINAADGGDAPRALRRRPSSKEGPSPAQPSSARRD